MKSQTLDDLQYENLKLLQNKKGYRSSEDSLILLNIIIESIGVDFSGTAFEFGTGSGIISILLSAKIPRITITTIEVQNSLFEIARVNILNSHLKDRINLIKMDGKNVKMEIANQKFDIAFANPPFYLPGKGKLSSNIEKRNARHEILCNMDDVIEAFAFLLKQNGVGFIIYPSFRWQEFDQKIRMREQIFVLLEYCFFKNFLKRLPKNISNCHLKSNLFVAKIRKV